MKNLEDAKSISGVDNARVYYWTSWKPEMKKNWVFLHPGASMNHSSLQSLEKGLNDRGHPTVILDPRGTGYSKLPLNREYHTLDKCSVDIQRIVEQESLENPEFLAHSFGFLPIVDYVSRTGNAEKITGVCVSPNFSKTADPLMFNLWVNGLMEASEYIGSSAMCLINAITWKKRVYNNQNLPGESELRIWQSIIDIPRKEVAGHMLDITNLSEDISPQLRKIACPVQLIHGDKDVMVRPYAGDIIANLVRGKCTADIVSASHTLPVRNPEKVLEIIDKYEAR